MKSPRPCQRTPPGSNRNGSTLVEFALVLPLLLLVVFSFVEFDRYVCVVHAAKEAARVGCREAILTSATKSSVEAEVGDMLAPFGVETYTVTITPDMSATVEPGSAVTVAISVNYADVSWVPTPTYLGSKVISIKSTLPKEK